MKYLEKINSLNEKNILALIFIIALILRLVAVFNLPPRYQIPLADASEYDKLAMNLLAGKGLVDTVTGLPTSWRVPLYPLFLAFIYLIFGHSYFAARIIQSILGALLCVIIFYIGKITFNRKVGLLSAIILSCYQPFIFYAFYGGPTFLLSENLFTFLLALLVLSLIKDFTKSFPPKGGFISGILNGLLTLTRPVAGLFPAVIFILLLFKNKYSLVLSVNKILPLLIGFILVILPWTVRNYFIHKAFIPFSTEGGLALACGNNPYVKGDGLVPQAAIDKLLTEADKKRLSTMSEIEIDKMYRKYAKEFLLKNYKKIPKIFFRKVITLWDLYITDYDSTGQVKRKYNLWYSIVFIFALFGIVRSIKFKLNINSSLLISLFLYFTIIAIITVGGQRFRYPAEPYLIIFASVGAFTIFERFKKKFLSYLIIAIVIGINLLFYIYSDSVLNFARSIWKHI